MKSKEPAQIINEKNNRETCPKVFLGRSKILQDRINALVFFREFLELHKPTDQDEEGVLVFTSDRLTGLYLMIKDVFLCELPGTSEIIDRYLEYAPSPFKEALFDAIYLIGAVMNKLSFVQMFTEIQDSGESIQLSHQAVNGLAVIIKDTEYDLAAIQDAFYQAGKHMSLSVEADAGNTKRH
jgi:hypothetical protein